MLSIVVYITITEGTFSHFLAGNTLFSLISDLSTDSFSCPQLGWVSFPSRVFIPIDGMLVSGKLLVLVPFESPTGTEKNSGM